MNRARNLERAAGATGEIGGAREANRNGERAAGVICAFCEVRS